MENLIDCNGLITISFEDYLECIEIIKKDAFVEGVRASQYKSKKRRDLMKIIHEKNDFKEAIKEYYGRFYFYMYDNVKTLSRQNIFRLLYLCTFMDYDNMLSVGNTKAKRFITVDELQEILGLSKRETFNVKKCLLNEGIIEINKNKHIKIKEKYCKKGIVSIKDSNAVRIYDNGIKELYLNSNAREHKKLGLLIELLPFVNLKWNVLCKNPTCEMVENIEGFTIKDIGSILNYKNTTELRNELLKLTVGDEPVIANIETNNNNLIAVNPLIYYKGTRIEDLIFLINIFRVK